MNNNVIEIIDNKDKIYSYSLESLAFSVFNNKFYNTLVFYKKSTGTFGQTIYTETADFIAFKLNISWDCKQLKIIADKLKSLNIEDHLGKDKNALDRIF